MADQVPRRARYALVVACAEYDDPRLQELSAPLEDAASFAATLEDPARGDFAVTLAQNQTSWAVSEVIEAFFSECRPTDLLLLYFSGHGIKDPDGRLYFAARNTRPDRLRSTGVPATFIHDLMQQSRARSQVLVLDCCHSGAFARGMVAKSGGQVGIAERLAGRGRVILAASDALQYAFESGEMVGVGQAPSSVFTHCLVEGLRSGAADLDGDGYVTVDELYDYVDSHISEATGYQSPTMWAFDMQGELVIARNPAALSAGANDRATTEIPVLLPPKAAPGRLPAPSRSRRRLWISVATAATSLALIGLLAFQFWPRGSGGSSGQPPPDVIRVNFQSPDAPTPEGYIADYGEPYGPRTGSWQGHDLTYGWVHEGTHQPVSIIGQGRDRNMVQEQRVDTLIHMEGNDPALGRAVAAAWEMAVPVGRYAVSVGVGDQAQDSTNTINVEGLTAIKDFQPTQAVAYEENTVVVTVQDSRLTVDSIGGDNTKINYVVVRRL
jgi:hypothetical protein